MMIAVYDRWHMVDGFTEASPPTTYHLPPTEVAGGRA